MASDQGDAYLKYALFCRDTEELSDGNIVLKELVDLIDLPVSKDAEEGEGSVVAEVDLQLAFCIGGAAPGTHYLLVAIKAPGAPLDPRLPNASSGRREYYSNGGSSCSESRCSGRDPMLPPYCWTECPWERAASW